MRPTAASDCAHEPIHRPGAVQPHGYFFCLDEDSLTVQVVSANVPDLLGRPLAKLIGAKFTDWLDDDERSRLRFALSQPDLRSLNPLKMSVRTGQELRGFDAIAHRSGGRLIVEWEPSQPAQEPSFQPFFHQARSAMLPLSAAWAISDAAAATVKQVRQISGFDRVLLYRFDEQWNGEVLAEDKSEGVVSYLGLHFPAVDIPAQARKLYALNWIRLIPDAGYQPVPLLGATGEAAESLDLSFSTLRAISPVHLEYMRNMGTAASMSVSILLGDRLWGLISCHHRQPRFTSYQVRSACEFIGHALSFQLQTIAAREAEGKRLALRRKREQLFTRDRAKPLRLGQQPAAVAAWPALVNAEGAALVVKDRIILSGHTPSAAWVRTLLAWLRESHDGVFVHDSLPTVFAPAADVADCASGLLALAVTKAKDDYLLWFRPELVHTVNWAGDPVKTGNLGDGGPLRPRRSFELWQQTVRQTSRRWDQAEIDAALEVRNGLVLEQLEQANHDLAVSNEELDAFTHIAAHDLKEPLRGIRNYLGFVLEDHAPVLAADAVQKLEFARKMSLDMEQMLGSLYRYSRVGTVHLAMALTPLEAALEEALLRLKPLIEEHGVHIVRPAPLPAAWCDKVRTAEVFYNLIANAVRYNDKAERCVEIGCCAPPPATDLPANFAHCCYVRDNGIGIALEHQAVIFAIFRRLHAKSSPFGSGTGAGLTIAKKIIERQHGRFWLESQPDVGSTFYFTLAASQPVSG